jgi:hypothetical protein
VIKAVAAFIELERVLKYYKNHKPDKKGNENGKRLSEPCMESG